MVVLDVLKEYRRRGVAEMLILHTLDYGKNVLGYEGAEFRWTFEDNDPDQPHHRGRRRQSLQNLSHLPERSAAHLGESLWALRSRQSDDDNDSMRVSYQNFHQGFFCRCWGCQTFANSSGITSNQPWIESPPSLPFANCFWTLLKGNAALSASKVIAQDPCTSCHSPPKHAITHSPR